MMAGVFSGISQRLLHRLAYNVPGGYRVRPLLHRFRGVEIGRRVWISRFVYIDDLHPEAISIGDNCSLGLRSTLISHFYWGPRTAVSRSGPIVIEPDVFIGPHSVILPDVQIGRGAVIQAGTVVSRDVPPAVLWGNGRAEALARVGVPLTHSSSYEDFAAALRPLRKNRLHRTKRVKTNINHK
jgi:acetyltransferase-like isoleucine patch superfamily enzyme